MTAPTAASPLQIGREQRQVGRAQPLAGRPGLMPVGIDQRRLADLVAPRHFTLWEAASSLRTQAFLLVGALFLLPIVLAYAGWSYWVFRGKARADVGYH